MIRTIALSLMVAAPLPLASAAYAQSSHPFVEEDFVVPQELVTKDFRLRMLSVNDVVKDYDAVISSAPKLLELFPHWGGWPKGLSLEDNLVDLGWHQKEFSRRSSFAYTVVSLDGSMVLGCVYIDPTRKVGYDATVELWARDSALGDEADQKLEAAVKSWIAKEWRFKNVAYPGRDIALDVWAKVPTTKR